MTILPKGGVLINIHTSLTVRVYNIHALQTLDNRIYVRIRNFYPATVKGCTVFDVYINIVTVKPVIGPERFSDLITHSCTYIHAHNMYMYVHTCMHILLPRR